MKARFIASHPEYVIEVPPEVDNDTPHVSKKKKKKKGNIYSDALRIANMNEEQLEQYRRGGVDAGAGGRGRGSQDGAGGSRGGGHGRFSQDGGGGMGDRGGRGGASGMAS